MQFLKIAGRHHIKLQYKTLIKIVVCTYIDNIYTYQDPSKYIRDYGSSGSVTCYAINSLWIFKIAVQTTVALFIDVLRFLHHSSTIALLLIVVETCWILITTK